MTKVVDDEDRDNKHPGLGSEARQGRMLLALVDIGMLGEGE